MRFDLAGAVAKPSRAVAGLIRVCHQRLGCLDDHFAKSIAVGANAAGIALPFLAPASRSAQAVSDLLDEFITGLRIAMFASGSRTVEALPQALYVRGSDATLT